MGSSVTIVTAIAYMAPGYTVYCPPVQANYPFYIQNPLYVVCTQQSLRQHSEQHRTTAHTFSPLQPITYSYTVLLCGAPPVRC